MQSKEEDKWECKKYGLSMTPAINGKRMCAERHAAALADPDHMTFDKCLNCDLGAFYTALIDAPSPIQIIISEEPMAKKCAGQHVDGDKVTPCEKGAIKKGLCSKCFRLKYGRGIHDDEIPIDMGLRKLTVIQPQEKRLLKPGQYIIDFFGHDDLHNKIKEMSLEDLRTIENQVLWLIKKQIKYMSTSYLGGREAPGGDS